MKRENIIETTDEKLKYPRIDAIIKIIKKKKLIPYQFHHRIFHLSHSFIYSTCVMTKAIKHANVFCSLQTYNY